MSLQKWTIRFPSLLSFTFLHSSSLMPHSFICLCSSYHRIQVFFTLMAMVNDRVGGLRRGYELGEANAGVTKTEDVLWAAVGVAECVFALQQRWQSIVALCDSAEFSGYKQTLPGCMLLGGKRKRDRWRRLKWRKGRGWVRRRRRRKWRCRRNWRTKRMRRREITTKEMVTDGEGHVLLPA